MGLAKRREDRRLMLFEDTYSMWTERRLTQAHHVDSVGEWVGLALPGHSHRLAWQSLALGYFHNGIRSAVMVMQSARPTRGKLMHYFR